MGNEWMVGSGPDADFCTLQTAINAARGLGSEITIRIAKGTYREKVRVPAGVQVRLIGEGAENTRIEWNDYARKPHPDGQLFGTFRTPTLTIEADGVRMEDLTVANVSGPRSSAGQAIALAVTGDMVRCERVILLGQQDTLFTGGTGHQYFHACRIEGDVDFIFGPASVVFDRCLVRSTGRGYITAASTPKTSEMGYLFWQCRLLGPEEPSVYLGRPWRPYSSVTWVDTEMGAHIRPEGWDDWHDARNHETVRYREYGSFGPGARTSERVAWAAAEGREALPTAWERASVLEQWGFAPLDQGGTGTC